MEILIAIPLGMWLGYLFAVLVVTLMQHETSSASRW